MMKRYYLIDHRALFLFGYLFYLGIPYVVGITNGFADYEGMQLYQDSFSRVPERKLDAYLLITLTWLPAFYGGHFCFKLLKPYKRSLEFFPATPVTRSLSYFAVLLFGALIIFSYLSRGSLFGGYGSFDIAARGKMASLLVIFNFFLLYQMVSRQKISSLLVAGTIITTLLTFSMGGRLYGLQTLLIFLLYKTSFAEKRWQAGKVLLFTFLGFLLAAIAGIWRQGGSFSTDKALFMFVAEPTFTWISNSSFLAFNEIPVINVPLNYLSSFLNLVPNTVLKLSPYIISTRAMGFTVETPLGAESAWSSYMINFGSVGSCVYIFCIGFVLNMLRHMSEKSRFAAVYYIMFCSMLPFQFFRDSFFIINKQLFFNFLFLPAVILLLIKTVLYLQKKQLHHT
jgi:hypothetical protein